MNNQEIIMIDELLKGKEYLKSIRMYRRSFNEVKSILEMPEWEEEKFQPLLTSNIWRTSYENIKLKLYLPYWNEKKYEHLLNPSIFSISNSNIHNGINLLKKYSIDQYITNKCLRLKTSTLENLINYLIENNVDLVVESSSGDYKLNPILNCDKGMLKKKYNIDINNLEKKGGKSK